MASQAQTEANRKNGRLGGRPPGSLARHNVEAVEARKRIVARVSEKVDAILDVLFAKALEGDLLAIKELLDRGFGKPAQAIDLNPGEGNTVVFLPLELMQKRGLPSGDKVIDIPPSQ